MSTNWSGCCLSCTRCSWVRARLCWLHRLTPGGNKSDVMKRCYHLSSLHTSSGPHLSITARHSFLQVKRLPRRRRKVPGAVVRGGGVCLHSISSRGNGAGRMFRVAPAAGGLLRVNKSAGVAVVWKHKWQKDRAAAQRCDGARTVVALAARAPSPSWKTSSFVNLTSYADN